MPQLSVPVLDASSARVAFKSAIYKKRSVEGRGSIKMSERENDGGWVDGLRSFDQANEVLGSTADGPESSSSSFAAPRGIPEPCRK